MIQCLRTLICLLLSSAFALAGLSSARASHIMAGQLLYRYVSGDTYEVTLTLYRDCSGPGQLPTTVTIEARQSCGGTAVAATLLEVPSPAVITTDYCSSVFALAACSPSQTTYPNYQKANYRGTLVLPPAAAWILSYEDCCRPNTANLPAQANFRIESTLNNLVTVNGVPTRMNNSSPLFSSNETQVPFVTANQQSIINLRAVSEVDSDSLVYELDQPLAACRVYIPYGPRYNAPPCAAGPLPNPAPGTSCYLDCGPLQSSNYAATLPLPVTVDTIGVCGTVAGTVYTRTMLPRFSLNPTAGQIRFTPNVYRPGSAALGYNKYVVVGKVTEYRRLPGSNRRYRVGSVRRDYVVIVFEGPGNTQPNQPILDLLSGYTVGLSSADTTSILVNTCNYSLIRLRFADADNLATPTHPAASPLQNLRVRYIGAGTINFNQLQNGDIGTCQMMGDITPTPEMLFYLQPGAAYTGRTIYIPLRIEDDGCPIKGIRYHVVAFRIVSAPVAVIHAGASGASASQTTICAGESLTLTGQVLRPDSVLLQSTTTTVAQVYAYQWRTLAGGNLPLVPGNPNLTVSPTQTTRYYLTVTPTVGFAQGTCNDTTSVLVRVMPRPNAPTIMQAGNVLTSSAPTGNQWYRNGTAIAGATGQSLVPSTPGSYTVTTNLGTGPTQCSSAPSAPTLVATAARSAAPGTSLHIAPNPTPDGRVQVELTGYRQATTLLVYDVLGRPVHTATLAAPTAAGMSYGLDLSALPAGVYMLQVRTAGGVDVCRLVRE